MEMRTQFIKHGDYEADYEASTHGTYIDEDGDEFTGLPGVVVHDAPYTSVAVEVEGGYMAFESVDDYNTWKNQV